MILRKLADAIRGQNWFTVVLEVLIVVVGIFIGLQVDDWSQRRVDDVKEQAILASLAREFRTNLREIEFSLIHAERKGGAAQEIQARAAGRAPSDTALDTLIGDLTFWNMAPMADGALRSYLQGGDLEIIRNIQLREVLATWPGKLVFLRQTQSQEYNTYKTVLMPFLFEHASVPQINNAFDPHAGSNSIVEFISYGQLPVAKDAMDDHKLLLENQKFRNILVQIYWDMKDVRVVASQIGRELQDTLSLIEAEMKQPVAGDEETAP